MKKMQFNNALLNKSNTLKILYIALFYVFIIPYSIIINNQGVSANYLFMFFPFIAYVINNEFTWPPKSVIIFMAMLSLIFIIGSISQVEYYDLILRRSASFIVFMSVFSFMFVKIDSDMIQSFKLAIILWSLFESSITIIEFIGMDGNNIGLYAKGILGNQRSGFVYLLGFWSIVMLNTKTNALKVVKFFAAYIVLVGLFLTYTRSSIWGFSLSTTAYFIYLAVTSFNNSLPIITSVLKIFYKVLYIIMLLVLVAVFFRGPVQYYSNTIFNYIFSTQAEYVQDDELNLYTSWIGHEKENKYFSKTNINSNMIEAEFELKNELKEKLNEQIQDSTILSSRREFMDTIIVQVAKSYEAILSQQNLNKAKVDLNRIMDIENNMQAQVAQALQEKSKAEISNNSNDIARMNGIYQKYVEKEKITYQHMVDQQAKVVLAQNQKNLTLNRLLTIELQQLLANTKKLLEIAKNQEAINIIKQKNYDIKSQISILAGQSLSLDIEDSEGSAVRLRMKDKGTSIGYRVFMHEKVFDQTYNNPLIGSAFLGVWTLFEDKAGSAHSQYLDMLFRVGVISFIVYLLFIFKVTLFLYKKEIGLFFGFIGFLFFGMFHETIKLSQGGFIFAFLFAMWAQRQYPLRDIEK